MILSIRWEFQFWEEWGGSLKKVLILVQRPQHKSTPDPLAAPKNIPFGTIFIEFGDTETCCTFSWLELAPKSIKKANWRSQLHAERSKLHSIPLGQSENNSFCGKAQRKRDMCDPWGKNPILGHSQRLKKVLLTAQSCASLHKCPIIMQIPRGYQKKKFVV